jgi:hypothetical protein
VGRIVIAVLSVFVVPIFAAAQSRGRVASAPAAHGPVAAPHVSGPRNSTAPRAAAPQTSGRSSARLGSPIVVHRGGRPARRGTGVPFNSDQVDFQNVPGLGFDYAHLAAISGNRRVRGSRFKSGFPFGFSGFLLSPPVIVEEVTAAEPQQSVVEEEAPADAALADPERSIRSRAHAAAPQESLAPPAPQPDVEQYVFVRRDGGLVFAVAYSWDNGTLRYVTPEGFRRTIASDALDLTATQQFNEQRGLTFRFPA